MNALRLARPLRLLPVALAASACIGSAHAQTNQELKGMLDQALKTIQELQGRVQALEKGQPAAASAPAPGQWGAPVTAPNTAAEAGTPGAEKARVEVYGQVMLDGIYDFKRMNPDFRATLRPSQIPIACPAPGCGKEGEWVFSARQSSFGVRSFIPTAWGELRTDLSFDLFGSDGSTSIHWLSIWAELDRFGAGQTYSNFMDIDVFPSTIDYWGPSGMVFVRNPQLRYKAWGKDGMSVAVALEAPNSALDTGKISEVSPDFGAGFTGWNRLPDLTASWRMDHDKGHFRAAAILRQVGYQNTTTADGEPSGHEAGYGLNLTGTYKVFGKDQFNAGLVWGKGIASYMNDGGVDLAPSSSLQAEAVESLGWLLYYNHWWNDKWSSALGYSAHQQSTTDGQTASAFRRGSYANLNLLHMPMKNVLTGLELVWGEFEQKDGQSEVDYRLQFSTKVTF
jgi:hypothetical protein